MDLHQLRCFLAAADELHFGHAAQALDMLPAALGRQIRLLEEDIGTRLFSRTTRNVALTEDGAQLLEEARKLIAQADAMEARFRTQGRKKSATLRIGAIDSAAAGLMPLLLQDIRAQLPQVNVQIVEDKTIRLLPRLRSGRLDLAFVRPPDRRDRGIAFQHLIYETVVVAIAEQHPLARHETLVVEDLADVPLIVPERRSRPHSHDLTMRLFAEAGVSACVGQIADEKQTIINLVAAGFGVALVPRWTSRLAVPGVAYIALEPPEGVTLNRLPLSLAWLRNVRDPLRDVVLELLRDRLERYTERA